MNMIMKESGGYIIIKGGKAKAQSEMPLTKEARTWTETATEEIVPSV